MPTALAGGVSWSPQEVSVQEQSQAKVSLEEAAAVVVSAHSGQYL